MYYINIKLEITSINGTKILVMQMKHNGFLNELFPYKVSEPILNYLNLYQPSEMNHVQYLMNNKNLNSFNSYIHIWKKKLKFHMY